MRKDPPGRRAIRLSADASAANKTLLRLTMSLSTVRGAFGWRAGLYYSGIFSMTNLRLRDLGYEHFLGPRRPRSAAFHFDVYIPLA